MPNSSSRSISISRTSTPSATGVNYSVSTYGFDFSLPTASAATYGDYYYYPTAYYINNSRVYPSRSGTVLSGTFNYSTANRTSPLNAVFKVEYTQYYYTRSYHTGWSNSQTIRPSGAPIGASLTGLTRVQNGVTQYQWSWYTYSRTVIEYGSRTATLTIYTPPLNFSFLNCASGNTWKVEDGLQSLITNIKDFQTYATIKKKWLAQSDNVSTCPSWASPLTAENINSLYAYVGGSSSYSAGDTITAAMFNNLAAALNAR